MMNVGNVMTWIIIVCHILGAFLLYYEDRDKIRGSLDIFNAPFTLTYLWMSICEHVIYVILISF